jgi:predicted transcriptional regulator
MTEPDLTALTAKITAAYVANNAVAVSDIPALIYSVRSALERLGKEPDPVVQDLKPAVPIRRSVTPDYIVCLEDGKKLKMLKRHLRTTYDMSPEQYRTKWGLPREYPMVAPNYTQTRSAMAKSLGLGRIRGGRAASSQPAETAQVPEPKAKGRRRRAAA